MALSKSEMEQLAKDLNEIKKNGGTGNYEEVKPGKYEVMVKSMEIKDSKNGRPMLAIAFKIREGKYKNSYIWMNQVIDIAFGLHNALVMINALAADEMEIEFDPEDIGFKNLADQVLDVEEITGDHEYLLDYAKTDKGFNTFEILEVYDI